MKIIRVEPWYEYCDPYLDLNEKDFNVNEFELNNIVSFYKKIINFECEEYNTEFILRDFKFIDFLNFDYDDEAIMKNYMEDIISQFKFFYAIPLIFDESEFNIILNYFKPSVVSKLKSSIFNYNRVFGSMISDYSGEFFVIFNDFKAFCIVKNGHYLMRFHNIEEIYIDNWSKLESKEIELYDYDRRVITQFQA